jgi:HSP20 family protein
MATSLMLRNPFGALDTVQSRMWDWFTTPYGSTPLSKLIGETNTYVPPVDIYETNEEVIVAASIPGLDVTKVDIQVLEDRLTLVGEQNSIICFEPEENMVQHLQGIPRYGGFSFSFVLPCAVEPEQSQAKYENGLLCMRFLKAARVRPVRVPITKVNPEQVIVETPAPQIASKQSHKTTK